MSGEQIVIEVSPVGNIRIETTGFVGGACAKATEQLEIVLGGHGGKKKTDYKPEFSMPATTGVENHRTF